MLTGDGIYRMCEVRVFFKVLLIQLPFPFCFFKRQTTDENLDKEPSDSPPGSPVVDDTDYYALEGNVFRYNFSL